MRKEILIGFGIIAISVLVGELIAKYGLGLGDPPLSMPDERLDYIFAPNQSCIRFGNTIIYNNASMRCNFEVIPEFNGMRIFLVGDSVVNGGVLTDHHDLATTILQEQVDPSKSKIQVCNVSAGSWGPGNYAAYFRRHSDLVRPGDILVLEVNSHDLWEDDPEKSGGSNVGKDISLPDHKPWCALWDGFHRYFMPRLRRYAKIKQVNTKVDVPKWEMDSENESAKYNLMKLDEVYSLPWARRCLLIHRSRKETANNEETIGETKFREYAVSRGIDLIYLELDSKVDYRDQIHLSESGQRKMAEKVGRYLELLTI